MKKKYFILRAFAVVGMLATTTIANTAAAALLTTTNATLSSVATSSSVDIDGVGSIPINPGVPGIVQVSGFDSALGALQSIEVKFDGSFTSPFGILSNHFSDWPECDVVNVSNSANGSCVYEHGFQASFSGLIAGPSGVNTEIVSLSLDESAQTIYSASGGGSPGSSGSAGVTSFTGNPGLMYLAGSSPFAPFIGDGSNLWDLTFTLELNNFNIFTNCEATGNFQCTTATGSGRTILDGSLVWEISNLEVTYSYIEPAQPSPNTPVSAPASLALLGLSLAGLGWSRRKRLFR